MVKHTPGPWKIYDEAKDDTTGEFYPGIDVADDSLTIIIWGDDEDESIQGIQGHTKEERFANAKLIAAAPDLLAALETLVKDYVDEMNESDADFILPEQDDAVIAARAAIKKATE